MHSVTVIVINFNGKQHLEGCLRSVQAADGPIEEIILVDDCSTDGSVEFVQQRFPDVRIIRLTQNEGPSAARNAGIGAARTPWVCLLDNDVVVDRQWLIPLVETMEAEPDVALCSSRILFYEKPDIIGTDGDEAHFVGMMTKRHAGRRISELKNLAPQEIIAAPGISVLIDKTQIRGEGYFDVDFFYNFEDLDFCLRSQILGSRCLVVPQSVVYHKYLTGGVPDLTSSQLIYSSQRAFYVFRNRWFVILKYYARRTLLVLAPALLLFELVTLAFAIKKGVLRAYAAAWKSLWLNLPDILRKRRQIQIARVVPDREFLSASRLTLARGAVQDGVVESGLAEFVSTILHTYWRVAWRLL